MTTLKEAISIDEERTLHRVVKVTPNGMPPDIKVMSGGIFEFKNEHPECEEFEIVFPFAPQLDPRDKLTGTTKEPIVIHMPDCKTIFVYYIVYKCGGKLGKEGEFKSLRTCGGCE